MQRVFVSYSRRNRTFAERLARDLGDAGLEVWIDFRQIHAGELWQQEIYRGIERSDIVIVCLSPDAVVSEWVQREANTAREQEKLIIPVMVENAVNELRATEELRWLLDVHFIQFEDRYEEAFPEVLLALPGKRRVGPYDEIDAANIPNPFKGLEAFQQTDAQFFFGREKLITKSLDRLRLDRQDRFVGVVGASGSGKSSLVRAGVIPALRSGALPGSEQWRVLIFTPGEMPVDALAQRLSPLIETRETSDLVALLHEAPDSINSLVAETLAGASEQARILLVVDQFEEVFTRAGEAERSLFLKIIRDAAVQPGGRALVLITMRADFFDQLGRYPDLAVLFEHENMVIVTEMTPAELLRSIEGPAEAVGLVYDEGLPQRILEEVRRQPGSLPLLQYALKELYMRRDGVHLTTRAYEEIGGVQQALATHAEKIYVGLNAAQQSIMRRVLLRLIEVGDSGEATRRKVDRDDLSFRDVPREVVQELIDLMTAADSRLLIASREIKASDDLTAPTTWIEISHEALIRNWDRFTGWVAENREDLRFGSEVLQAAADWRQSGGDEAYLLRGNRLLRAEIWVQNADANELQREFIRVSVDARRRREVESQEQAERELALQRQATNRLRWFVAVLVLSLIVAIGLSVFALQNLERANIEQTRAADALIVANENEQKALSLALSASSSRALGDGNVELAVLLGVSANQIIEPPPQSQRTLAEVAYAPGTRRFFPSSDHVRAVAFMPAGNPGGPNSGQVLTANGRELVLWDVGSGEVIRRFGNQEFRHLRNINSVAFSPDGRLAVSGGEGGAIIVWDVASGQGVRRLEGYGGTVTSVAFSPDGRRVLSAGRDAALLLWDVDSGAVIRRFEGHVNAVNQAVFNPDGSLILSAGQDGTARLWQTATGDQVRNVAVLERANILSVAFSPVRADRAVTGDESGRVILWDVLTSDQVRVMEEHESAVNSVGYSPAGDTIVSASADGRVILWDAITTQPVATFTQHNGAVYHALFTPDGQRLLTAAADNSARLTDVFRAEEIRRYVGHARQQAVNQASVAVYSVDDSLVLSGSFDRTLRLWNAENGLTIRQLQNHPDRVQAVALSENGEIALAGVADGRIYRWDLTTGEQVAVYEGHSGAVQSVHFLPGDARAISGASDGALILWDLETGEIIQRLGPAAQKEDPGHIGPVFSIDISPDGRRALSGSGDGAIILWNLETGTQVEQIEAHSAGVRSVALSPAGDRAVSGSVTGVITLWDLTEEADTFGTPILSIEGHARAVMDLEFSPDGRMFVSGSLDDSVRLWELESGFELRRFIAENGVSLRSVAFKGDGRAVLTGMSDGTLREWRVLTELEELIAWTFANRYVPEPSCDDRRLFNLTPLCDEDGFAPTRTPYPQLSPTNTPVPLMSPGRQARVNTDYGDSLRLRADPEASGEGNIVERLPNGTMVTLLEGPLEINDFVWWRVETEAGVEGWTVESVAADGLQTLVPIPDGG